MSRSFGEDESVTSSLSRSMTGGKDSDIVDVRDGV